jgi:ABC-type Fe3+ transport system permease subunit
MTIILLVGTPAAYVLARYDFPGNRLIYYSMLAGLTFPVFLAIVPLFFVLLFLIIAAGIFPLAREGFFAAGSVNQGALLAQALTIADLTRLEIHGPAEELEKLKAPLAHLNPVWFALSDSKL